MGRSTGFQLGLKGNLNSILDVNKLAALEGRICN
jgi:hypothetical protein